MEKKICIITGATSGIGFEAAKALAMQNFCIVLACRNEAKSNHIRNEIIAVSGNCNIYSINLDLSSFESIELFSQTFLGKFDRLDVLINNAGTFCDRQHTTKDGFEKTMGVNYIGAYYLTELLLPIIKSTPKSRIINVSSIVGLNCSLKDGVWDFHNIAHGFRAYNASKLAQILYTIDLAHSLKNNDVTVNVLHPGVVGTNIWTGEGLLLKLTKPIMKLIFPSPQKGAETILYLASSDEVWGITGKMFANCKMLSYKNNSLNKKLQDQLISMTQQAIDEVTQCKKNIVI